MDDVNTQKQGINPLLIIFLASGLMGLLAAVVMLLVEQGLTNNASTDNVTQVRTVGNDWEAQDFELTSLDGETVSLSDFEGRTIFLNFWRTDCPPCVRELPAMEEFVAQQGANGAVVLAVNQGENSEDISAFLDDLGISGLEVLLDEDLNLDNMYPVRNLPTTYIIDGEGMVRYTKIGEITLDQMYLYVNEVAG